MLSREVDTCPVLAHARKADTCWELLGEDFLQLGMEQEDTAALPQNAVLSVAIAVI